MIPISAAAPAAARQRVICQTASRPLRIAVVLESDTNATLRRAVRLLCSVWGGTNSIIVTGTASEPIHARWSRTIRSFDPDLVFFQAGKRRASRAKAIRKAMEALGGTPIWVVPLNELLQIQEGWTPVRASQIDREPKQRYSADFLARASAVEVAVLGLTGVGTAHRAEEGISARDLRGLAAASSLVADSPVAVSAIGVTRIRPKLPGSVPFLYYQEATPEAARVLWNLRALHGAVVFGGDSALERYVQLIQEVGRQRLNVIAVDPLTKAAEATAGKLKQFAAQPVATARWPRRWYRPIGGRADTEIEELPLVEAVAQIPRRPPAVRTPSGFVEISDSRGVYVLEVDLILPGEGRRMSLPPRADLTNALVARASGLASSRFSSFTTASRVAQGPTIVIAVRPGRWGRTIPLHIPTLTEIFNRIAESVVFELSDKGHYARWLANRLDGLTGIHLLMNDPRGGMISREFLKHHKGGTSTGAYRRSLTIAEMRGVFQRERQAKTIAKHMSPPDEDWLGSWLEWLTRRDVLKLGVRVKCPECLWGSLVTLGHFGETYDCPRCGVTDLIPANPTLAYQLAEAAHQFLANRSDVTALALAALQQRSRISFSADFDHDVHLSPSDIREIDLLAVTDGSVVIGECKANGKFDAQDFALLRRLAARIRPRVIVLGTDRECDGGCRPRCKGTRMLTASSDSALPSGAPGGIGPRERMATLRSDVRSYGTEVVVLCRGELTRNWQVPAAEFVLY